MTMNIANNPLILSYVTCAIVLCLKVVFMAPLTTRQRFKKKVFVSPEDVVLDKTYKVKFDDPDVERVRRAHLNDLENIPVFLAVSLLYIVIAQPSIAIGKMLLWAFTFARIAHTIVYAVIVLPPPARGLSFIVGFVITVYMAIATLININSVSDIIERM